METPNWILLQRFISGKATPDQQRQVDDFVSASDENKRILEELQWIWEHSQEASPQTNADEAFDRFKDREFSNELHSRLKQLMVHQREQPFTYLMKIAAVLLVSFLLGYSVHRQLTTEFLLKRDKASELEFTQLIQTEAGNRVTLTLGDGTEVILNSASQLRVRSDFNQQSRHIALDGEAFFKVTRNPNKPFFVHMDGAAIQVLGTSFSAQSRAGSSWIEVIVQEGKVAFISDTSQVQQTKSGNTQLLLAGDYLVMDKATQHLSRSKTDVYRHLMWIRGGLFFQNMPFSRVIEEIEQQYDVDIVLKERQLLNVPYNGVFDKASLQDVLSIIAQTMDLEVYYQAEYILLNPRKKLNSTPI